VKPLDVRLLRYAQATRGFMVVLVALGVLTAFLVIAQATLLADIISRVFLGGAGYSDVRRELLLLAAALVARAAVAWLSEVMAHRAAAAAKSQLRLALVEHSLKLGPTWLAGTKPGDLAVLSTSGVAALDAYFSRYLPQLILAAIVPVTIGLVVLLHDVLAAVIIGFTAPLIPMFMILIGRFTKSRVDRQWRTMSVLSGHFLDIVSGLPTLKIFGRAKAQLVSIRSAGEHYRRATLAVLRVSFLSALVLELLSTIAVALVAVSIGLRLVGGHLTLRTGLLVLILTPEVYLPIRLVGTHFHAAADGLGAAEAVFAVLELELPATGTRRDLPDLRTTTLQIGHLGVRYEGRNSLTPGRLTAEIAPGKVCALVGPSGEGKSTVLAVLLGFVRPTTGRIVLVGPEGEQDLADIDPDVWRAQLGYVGQQPHLFAGTVADNVRLGKPHASDAEVVDALRTAGLDVDPATELGETGSGLSAGQRRRVAIARAFVRDAPILLLDEPTAALDGAAEEVVMDAVSAARSRGTTVILVAHRPTLVALADTVIEVSSVPDLIATEVSA
jgi:thiol reductant ABC exporter CydD subunit